MRDWIRGYSGHTDHPLEPRLTGPAHRRHLSDACGLDRAANAAIPAWPSRRCAPVDDGPSAFGSRGTVKFAQAQTSAPLPLSGMQRPPNPVLGNRTRGGDAGTGPEDLTGSERDQIMASKKTPAPTTVRTQPVRQAITLTLVVAHAPHAPLATNLSRTFGLDEVDYAGIRESTEEQIGLSAKSLGAALNERAMQIHLQRIVGSFVSSAYGAAMFYGTKVSEARNLTQGSENDARDEDRDGVAGFESKAGRARLFAAQMALQSFALLAAAEGAVSAYAHITGDDWKPYEAPHNLPASTQRRSASAEMEAFRK